MPPLHSLLALAIVIVSILLGTLVLALDSNRRTNRAFGFFAVVISYWVFTEFILWQSATLEAATYWQKIVSFWPLAPIAMIHFALVATDRKIYSRWWLRLLIYLPMLIIVGFELFTERLTLGVEHTRWGYYYIFDDGFAFYASRLWAFITCFCAVGVCFYDGLTATEKNRRRAGLIYTMAFALPMAAILTNIMILPRTSLGNVPLRPLATLWMIVVMCWSIWRHNVFRPDQRAVAEKILETMADPLLLLDETFAVRYANSSAKTLFEDQNFQELKGQSFSSLLDPETCDVDAIMDDITTFQSVKSVETGILVPSGMIEGLLSAGYVVGKRGKTQGVVCIIHDITERKKAERKLRRIQQDLVPSSRIAERTEVLSGLLHNIKNVLNSVGISLAMVDQKLKGSKIDGLKKVVELLSKHESNLAQFFTEDPRGSKLLPYLSALTDKVESENENILQEIANLQKHFEHIKNVVEQRRSVASHGHENINLSELVEDALLLKEAELLGSSIVVERRIDHELVIQTDRHRMLQVLVNLVSNAIDSLKTIDLVQRELRITSLISEGYIRLEVKDSGQGIEPDDLERIFSFGFTTKEKGQGFGLDSCRRAVKDVGGTIEVKSEGLGKGATFTLSFPDISEKEAPNMSNGDSERLSLPQES